MDSFIMMVAKWVAWITRFARGHPDELSAPDAILRLAGYLGNCQGSQNLVGEQNDVHPSCLLLRPVSVGNDPL